MVNSSAMTAAHREKTDLLLQPPLAQIDMLNWSAFDRAIAAGYEYAVQRLEALPVDSLLRQGAQAAAPATPSRNSPATVDQPSFVPAQS
jgi:NTE family protein